MSLSKSEQFSQDRLVEALTVQFPTLREPQGDRYITYPTLKPEEPKRLKYWMIAICPELPDEEGPELFSIVPLISQVIFKQGGYIFRV